MPIFSPRGPTLNCGDAVHRAEDPRHIGRVETVHNTGAVKVRWLDTGWLEWIDGNELERERCSDCGWTLPRCPARMPAATAWRCGLNRGMTMKTAREPRPYAPCDVLGPVVRETDRAVTYRRRRDNTLIILARRWGVHVEPCPACPDHPKTRYPEE
jgi:hypothetical protein